MSEEAATAETTIATTEAAKTTAETTQAATTEKAVTTEAAKTVAAGAETKVETAKSYWPDDWRQKVAEHVGAGDKKAIARELKRLERFTDPNGIYAMSRELESRFDKGGLIRIPGEGAKEEEVAAFRKALGVPEKPEDYFKDIKLENGAVIGEADKPLVDSFAEAAHKAGAPPAVVNAALNWYFAGQEKQAAELDAADDTFRREAEQALKNEFGAPYQRYVNSVASVFQSAPGGTDLQNEGSLYARLMGGRTADGKIIGNDPDMVRWLVGLAREMNPVATVTEGGGSFVSIDAEIASIEAEMRDPQKRAAYYKDETKQARYRELLGAREKDRARKAA